jgi:2-polyprenyl-3-methyl-5-hydroxy-6-metoxy-1,4-benzoquinol methylase
MEKSKLDEIHSAQESKDRGEAQTFRKPFGTHWGSSYWSKWATVAFATEQLRLPEGARVLDLGVGTGWTSLFLAEAGYDVRGVTIAPAAVEIAQGRANRWNSPARFQVGDMEELAFGAEFDFVLIFDALHHCQRQRQVLEGIAAALKPGGWVLFGEPSVLHGISPQARRVNRDLGWVERGISVSGLKDDCAAVGLSDFRRFFEGTAPYASRSLGFAKQLLRLVAGDVAVAPQSSIWLAARKGA